MESCARRCCGAAAFKNLLPSTSNLIDDEFAALTGEIDRAVVGVIDDAGDRYKEVFTDAMRRINEVELDNRELLVALHEVTRLWSRDTVDFVLDNVPAAERDKAMKLLAKQLKVDLGDGDEAGERQKLADALSMRGIDAARGERPVLIVLKRQALADRPPYRRVAHERGRRGAARKTRPETT